MSVTFIKRECEPHPGCFTMSDRCDKCIDENLRDAFAICHGNFAASLSRALGKLIDQEEETK